MRACSRQGRWRRACAGADFIGGRFNDPGAASAKGFAQQVRPRSATRWQQRRRAPARHGKFSIQAVGDEVGGTKSAGARQALQAAAVFSAHCRDFHRAGAFARDWCRSRSSRCSTGVRRIYCSRRSASGSRASSPRRHRQAGPIRSGVANSPGAAGRAPWRRLARTVAGFGELTLGPGHQMVRSCRGGRHRCAHWAQAFSLMVARLLAAAAGFLMPAWRLSSWIWPWPKAGPCRIDVAAEKLSHGRSMGFGVVGSALQGGGVGLQRPGDRALRAGQPRLSQPVGQLWARCGRPVSCQCRAAFASRPGAAAGAEVQLRAKLSRGSSGRARAGVSG